MTAAINQPGGRFSDWPPAGFRCAVGDISDGQADGARPHFHRRSRTATTSFQHLGKPAETGFRGGRQQHSRQAGEAKKAGKVEGKIEETGTISGRFRKLLLSAHWLGDRFRHHGFERQSAAISRNALASLDFDRHHGRRLPDLPRFRPEAHP